MTPGIIKKLYHTTPVGLTDENKQEVYPITATSAVYSAPGESSFPNMSLDNILDALNQGYHYMGKASPTTNPGVFNHKVFYLASEAGIYSHFDGITVSGLTVLKTDGNSWSADAFNITGGGGGGGLTTAYIGTTMVQETPAPQQLSGISQLNLTSGARIYFGETAYIELNQYGFHFSEGIYSNSFVSAGGVGSGGGGGSYTSGNGINIVGGEISVKAGTGLSFDANGNLIATGGGSYVLPIASASTLGGIKVGSGLSIDSSGVLSAIGGTEGTVTSITLNSGTGIAVSDSGTAITTSGSRTISINSSYRNKIDHGDTAYSWGNHAAAGYADASVVNAALAEKQNVISDLETIRSNASSGNTAYGWGNHALAGYAMATDLASLNTRVISIEDWFEVVTVNGQQALHAKSSRAIYSDSWIAAGGIGSSSGGGGVDLDRVWQSLTNNTDKPNVKINIAHIPDITISKITDLESWIAGKGYLTSYTETDPTVPSWAKASSKPSYSLSEISGTDDLQAIEALTGTSGLLCKTAANTWSLDTTSYLTSGTTLDSIADGSTRKLADYVTLGTTQTITGIKTFTTNMFAGGDIIPSTDLGPSLGYSSLRFANLNVRTIGSLLEINFKSQDNSAQTGYLTFKDGWMVLRSGADLDSSYKQINFHETYGFYPVQSGVNLGGSSANIRWATIYGVNANLSGNLSLSSASYIDIGPVRITYDSNNEAIHITTNDATNHPTIGFYADGFVAAGGVGQTS